MQLPWQYLAIAASICASVKHVGCSAQAEHALATIFDLGSGVGSSFMLSGASSDVRCLAREGGGGGGRGRRDFECKFYLVATLHVMQFAEFMHAGNNIVGGLAFLSEYRRGQPPPPPQNIGGGGVAVARLAPLFLLHCSELQNSRSYMLSV